MTTDERDPEASPQGRAGRGCFLIAGILAAVVTLMLAVGPLIGIRLLTIVAGGVAGSQAANQSCVGGAPVGGSGWEPPPNTQGAQGLSGEQVALAQTLWEASFQLGYGEKGAVIILSTAMQEASLKLDPTPDENYDMGPLQQRVLVGWYGGRATREENAKVLNDPRQAARIFFEGKTVTAEEVTWARAAGDEPAGPAGYHIPGLKDIKDWQNLAVTVAAQKVQGSAFPDAYAKHESTARALIASFGPPPAPNPDAAAVAAPQAPTGQNCQPAAAPTAMNCPGTGNPAEKGLTPDAVLVLRCGQAQFPQIKDVGGVGDRPSNVDRDHQEGRAVDLMSYADSALGQQVAEWAKNNAAGLGVNYIIWNEHIWSVARAAEGWRQCGTAAAGCYTGPDNTAAHRDHVHVSVLGNGAVKPPAAGETGPLRPPIDPAKYSLGSRWGEVGSWARYHTGADLRAPLGTPIYAAAAGTFEAPNGGSWAGNHCVIRHPDGSATLYAHMTNPCPSPPGTPAQSGQPIGTVGLTGRTFGPHLHFEHYPAGRGRIGNPYTTDDPYQWMLGQGVRL